MLNTIIFCCLIKFQPIMVTAQFTGKICLNTKLENQFTPIVKYSTKNDTKIITLTAHQCIYHVITFVD